MELLPSQDEIEHSLFSSLLEELAERTEADSRTHEAQLRVTQKEKNGLVTKLTGVCIPQQSWGSIVLTSPSFTHTRCQGYHLAVGGRVCCTAQV